MRCVICKDLFYIKRSILELFDTSKLSDYQINQVAKLTVLATNFSKKYD